MTKKSKVLSKSAIAAALAAAAVIPVVATPASAAVSPISEVVYVVDGKNVSLDFATFTAALNAETLKSLDIKFIQTPNGNYYTFADFTAALNATETDNPGEALEAALETLTANPALVQPITTVPGTITDGAITPTPTPTSLNVESVSAINATSVEVNFPEITTAIEDANVVVKDGEGNVVPTEAKLLAEGETSAEFTFTTPFKADHKFTGVWTVNEKEYSFDAINQLADIVAAVVTSPNQIKLQAALDAAGITYADETRIAAYLLELQKDSAAATSSLEAVQKAITKVDKDAAEETSNEAAVKAVVDAKTQAQLLRALQANFDVVNPEWIVKYDEAIDFGAEDVVTVEIIQGLVYEVNVSEVGPKVETANMSLDSKKVSEARTLVTNWIPAIATDVDSELAGLKEQLVDLLNVEDALIAVDQAKTNSALKTALVNLDKLETELVEKYTDTVLEKEFFIKDVEDANLTAYRTAIEEAEIGAKNQRKDIQKIVTDENTAAVGSAQTKVLEDLNAVTAKTAAANVVALLEKSQVLHEKTNKVNSAYAEAYKTAVLVAVDGEETLADADAVNTLVGTVNVAQDTAAQLAAVNTASTAAEMSNALIALEAANDATNFTNLASTAKLEVAGIVLAKRNAIEAGADQKAKEFKNAAAALEAVSAEDTGAIAERTAFFGSVNGADTIATMKTVLAGDNSLLPEFAKLGAVEQTEKAEAVLNKLAEIRANDEAPAVTNFKTIAEIKAAAGL